MKRLFAPLSLLLLVACPAPEVGNPSGDCQAEDDGARACYHTPDATDTYLPDCEAPLDRELWRVFAVDEATAYMIPRPDAMGIHTGICDGDDVDLAAVFEANGLCAEVADPDIINAMTPEDALVIGHALHENLVFGVEEYGEGAAGLVPWAPDTELLMACEGPLAGDARVEGLCAELATLDAEGTCNDLGRVLSVEQVTALAEGLNATFGIE